MADATADTATPDVSGLTPEQINKYLTLLRVGQGLPDVRPDQTPVDTSGFWGGLRHGISLLGEAAGSPGPGALGALSPKEREQAGLQSLSRFGTGLMAASHYVPGQTLGSNLAQGFQAAERGYDTTARQAMGMLAARQNYAVESQHADLKKLQAALPLLSLQQQLTGSANTQKLLSGEVTPGTNIGSGGSIGGPFMAALAVIESNDQNIVSRVDSDSKGKTLAQGGNPDEISQGHYQINPGTWRRYAKQAGVDPAQYSTPMKAPKEVQAAVASVIPLSAFGPRTQKLLRDQFGNLDSNQTIGALAGARAAPSAPGTAAAPPKAPPGQAPAPKAGGLPVAPEPPLATTAPAQTAQGPEEGAVQVAGRDVGSPTSGVIPTLPPAAARSAADVTDIEAGMANAQANPLVRQPGAVVTAQAGGQQPTTAAQYPPIKIEGGVVIPHPGSYSEFRAREYVPPPATEDFNPNLSPARQAAFDAARRGIQQRIANRPNLPAAAQGPEGTKIIEDRAALEAKLQEEMASKAQDAAVKRSAYDKEQDTRIQTRYEKEADKYDKAAAAQQAHSQAMTLKEKEGEISRLNTREGSFVESNKIVRDMIGKDAVAAAGQVQSLEGLHALSDNVGDKNTTLQSLANIKYGGTTLLNHLANIGIASKGDAGPIQMLQSGISGAITQLRAGVQMGALSDRDLSFIESQGPSLYEDQATRTAVIRYLQQAARAKMRFNTIYQEQMARPNMDSGTALEKTREIMDAKHPIVPRMTPEVAAVWAEQTPEAKAARAKWARENSVKQNMLVRQPDGSLLLLK